MSLAAFSVVTAGCGSLDSNTPLTKPPRAGTGVDVAAAAIAESLDAAAGRKTTVFGWGLALGGGRASFSHCTDDTLCDSRLIEVPARSIVAMKVVGRTRPKGKLNSPDGEETDVYRFVLRGDYTSTRSGAIIDRTRGIVYAAPLRKGGP